MKMLYTATAIVTYQVTFQVKLAEEGLMCAEAERRLKLKAEKKASRAELSDENITKITLSNLTGMPVDMATKKELGLDT